MRLDDDVPDLGYEQKCYICVHVYEGSRSALYVTRPDGDWCFLCGDDHPDEASAYRVVGMGHVVGRDSTLRQVLDLDREEEAERAAVGAPWSRRSV